MKKKHIHYDTNAAIFRQKASKEELRFKFIRLNPNKHGFWL